MPVLFLLPLMNCIVTNDTEAPIIGLLPIQSSRATTIPAQVAAKPSIRFKPML